MLPSVLNTILVFPRTKMLSDLLFPSCANFQNLVWIPRNRKAGGGEDKETVVDAKNIKDACEGELRRLQTDYLDLFQIHWSDRYE